MGNGRKMKRKITVPKMEDVNLVMARLREKDDVITSCYTTTYTEVLEKTEDEVVLSAPELNIEKRLKIQFKEDEPSIGYLFYELQEDKSVKMFTFTDIDPRVVVRMMNDVINKAIEDENNELFKYFGVWN